MTAEERDAQFINRVYGNIGIENPRVTREFVAEQLKLYRQAAAKSETHGKKS